MHGHGVHGVRGNGHWTTSALAFGFAVLAMFVLWLVLLGTALAGPWFAVGFLAPLAFIGLFILAVDRWGTR